MQLLAYILSFFISFIGMEFVARLSHKYIMHGFMWKIHKDHHLNTGSHLEHNDLFSILFAIPSFFLIFCGLKYAFPLLTITGAGMAAYGAAYFFIHDLFIHQRIKIFRNSGNNYLKALRRAHKIHHKNISKEHAESFGFLIVEKKYFIPEKNSLTDREN